jgi:hypothetical protein
MPHTPVNPLRRLAATLHELGAAHREEIIVGLVFANIIGIAYFH